MKKVLILIILFIPLLVGCGRQSDEEIAMQSEFNVTFNSIDKEAKTASFTINGLANEEEFAQVNSIITDSMDNQKVEGEYKVSVYSQVQDMKQAPVYGTTVYKSGKLTANEVKNISVEQYVEILNK